MPRASYERLWPQAGVNRHGEIEIAVPRDRAGRFDAQLIAKYRRQFPGFDDSGHWWPGSQQTNQEPPVKKAPIRKRVGKKQTDWLAFYYKPVFVKPSSLHERQDVENKP